MRLKSSFAIGTLVTPLTIERLFYGEVAIVLTKERKGWVQLISGRGKNGKTRSIDLKFIT